jgi:cellulose synthase A
MMPVVLKCFVNFLSRTVQAREKLSTKVSIPSSRINPYRMVIFIWLVVFGLFHYWVMHLLSDTSQFGKTSR